MIYNVYTRIMKTTIAKWGNSLAVRIPSKAIERLNVSVGEDFSVDIKDNSLVLSRSTPRYSLDDLVKSFSPKQRHKLIFPDDKPRGKEIW